MDRLSTSHKSSPAYRFPPAFFCMLALGTLALAPVPAMADDVLENPVDSWGNEQLCQEDDLIAAIRVGLTAVDSAQTREEQELAIDRFVAMLAPSSYELRQPVEDFALRLARTDPGGRDSAMLQRALALAIDKCNGDSDGGGAGCTWGSDPGTSVTLSWETKFLAERISRGYVVPGQEVIFFFDHVSDTDTCSDGTKANDPDVFAGIEKKDGDLPDPNLPRVHDGNSKIIYKIPTTALPGQSIVLELVSGDTRDKDHPCHDPKEPVGVQWRLTVSDGCPEIFIFGINDYIPPNVPQLPGWTWGGIDAYMRLRGSPPVGRENWNGHLINESFSDDFPGFNEAHWHPEFVEYIRDERKRFMFIVGLLAPNTFATNTFLDHHGVSAGYNILAEGVESATWILHQTYSNGSSCSEPFSIVRTARRSRMAAPYAASYCTKVDTYKYPEHISTDPQSPNPNPTPPPN